MYVYLKKDSGLNLTASIIRASDCKDMEIMMLEYGWGFVKEDVKGGILSTRH